MNIIDNEKRYNTIDRYYKWKYGKKVCKISLNAGFTCPNKDGARGTGGCIYCSKSGSGDFAGKKDLSIHDQFYQIKEIMDNKWKDSFYIAYFQANSNTYASVEKLDSIYSQVLNINEDIKEIAIATRCDCINEEVCIYLSELNKKIPITVELGLQSTHNKTLEFLNTCYTVEDFEESVTMLRKYDINVVVHIINGLPYETKDMMIKNIDLINKLDVVGIKIHSLMIIKDTLLEKVYLRENFKLLTLEEHVDITCDQIERLNKNIIIHRLSADCSKDDLVAPLWLLKKLVVMNEIDKEMKKRNTYQGSKQAMNQTTMDN
ncbi:MAG: TIGR01212 family radical SAM protein [bacterium]